MYSCPGCGSQMLFDIRGQELKCGRCDRTMSVEEADRKEARHAGESFAVDLLTCPTCGAEIRAVNTAAAAFCSYCGSSVMLEKKSAEFEPPTALIPFQVTREECFEKYQGMLKKSFCADHRLKEGISAESFRGIYVPYHTYNAGVEGTAVIEGTETKGDTTYYYNTSVELNHRYSGILHDASREMPDSVSEFINLSDDSMEKFVPFSPAYLSGFYADASDTPPDTYLPYAKSEAIRKGLEDTMPALKEDSLSYSTANAEKALMKNAYAEYSGDTLIPVWFMSMKNGKRVLYAVQNGVTGEMWADIPMDIPRFALVTLGLAVILFLLFNSFLTLRPEMAMVAAMLLAVFAQMAVNGRRTRLREKESGEEVAGGGAYDIREQVAKMKRLKRRVRRQEHGGVTRYLTALLAGCGSMLAMGILSGMEDFRIYKYGSLALTAVMVLLLLPVGTKRSKLPAGSLAAFTAMAAGCALLVLDPFHSADLPVYIVTLVIIAAVIWECLDLLKLHNKACSNPMPQFETHTGGEDRA